VGKGQEGGEEEGGFWRKLVKMKAEINMGRR
jgi:hypothetical protein